jgi:hypothetical protein
MKELPAGMADAGRLFPIANCQLPIAERRNSEWQAK